MPPLLRVRAWRRRRQAEAQPPLRLGQLEGARAELLRLPLISQVPAAVRLTRTQTDRFLRRCSRRQTVPTHAAGHPVITDIEDAVSPDCAAITVDCDPACPTCDKCSKVAAEDMLRVLSDNHYSVPDH